MNYLFLSIIIPIFIHVNFKIVRQDIKDKIIQNSYLKELLYILPFVYILIFLNNYGMNIGLFIVQIILTIFIGFTLYYHGVWGAGDAKYLIVLGLLIPHIGILALVSNIGLVTGCYLFLYFLWFYFGKIFWNWDFTVNLYRKIHTDIVDRIKVTLGNAQSRNGTKGVIFSICSWAATFLLFFVTLRFARLILLEEYQGFLNPLRVFEFYPELKGISFIVTFFIFRFLVKKIFFLIATYLESKRGININKNSFLFPTILFCILILSIYVEYQSNPYKIGPYLYKIFTIYLAVFILVKILFYSYKVAFHIAETNLVGVNLLKVGDIVDKEYLVGLFGRQDFLSSKGIDGRALIYEIENPLDKSGVKKIKKLFKDIELSHKKNNNEQFSGVKSVKVLNTFALSPYILGGFVITILFTTKPTHIFIYGINIVFQNFMK